MPWGVNGHGFCEPPGACRWDSDCARYDHCIGHTCVTPECSPDNLSPCGGYGCDGTGHCNSRCDGPSDCAPGNACADHACVPGNCDEATTGQCGNFACIGGICATQCATSRDCDPGYACARGTCVATPGAGAPCSDGSKCSVGTCIDGACVIDVDACVGSSCGTDHGVPCGTCPATRYCDSFRKCLDACAGAVCGARHGVSCGTCTGATYCDDAGKCVDACGGAVCGSPHGVSCGTCKSTEVCTAAGACESVICSAASSYCKGRSVYSCSSDGTTETKTSDCAAGTCCSAGHCGAAVCSPGAKFCDAGAVLTTCASDGCGGIAGGTACAPLDCSAKWGCSNHDVYAGLTSSAYWECGDSAGIAHSNTAILVSVTKTVQLLDFAQGLYAKNVSGNVRWMVYESSTQHGTYTQIFSRSTTIAPTSGVGAQFFAAPVGITLTAGKYYLVGVELSNTWDTNVIIGDAAHPTLTFGSVVEQLSFDCQTLGTTYAYDATNVTTKYPLAFELWTK